MDGLDDFDKSTSNLSETELKNFITKEAPPPSRKSLNSSALSLSISGRESPIVDEYGFVNKFACSRESYLQFRERYRGKKEEMERTWKKLVSLEPSTAGSSIGATRKQSTPPPQLSRSISLAANSFEYKFEPFNQHVKKALRQGIPSHLRPMAWFYYSGGEDLRGKHPNPAAFYESLLMQPKPSAFFLLTDRIKMDFRDILPTNELVRKDYFSAANTMINDVPDIGRVRIIPDNPPQKTNRSSLESSFSSTVPFMSRLYNVLVAFFMFRPRVEYCRAVCTIAAILLLVIQEEEKCFWTLSALFSNYSSGEEISFESPNEESISFHDYRNDDLEDKDRSEEEIVSTVSTISSQSSSIKEKGSSLNAAGFKYFPDEMFRDTSTCSYSSLDGFKAILGKKKPVLVSLFNQYDIPISLLTTTWFQSLFVDVLPTESSMRVLDAFIGEGFKILYRVALALFYINEAELMQKLKPRSNSSTGAISSSSPFSSGFLSSLLGKSDAPSSSANSTHSVSPQSILNLIKFMPKKQVDADVLMDFAFNKIGSLSLSSILAECKRAAEVEKPLQSIRRFSQTPETKLSMDTIRRVSTVGK